MGDRTSFGLHIDIGQVFGRHDHRYEQPPRDPLRDEAFQIARELDSGQTRRAADHLNRDLQTLPFEGQRRLVEQIDMFDRKGVGADLCLGRLDRQGGIWDDIRIRPPQYYPQQGPVYGGRPGYPYPGGNYPNGGGRPEVDIRIDLGIFKGRR